MAPGRPTGPSNALCLWFARQARSLAHPALVPAIPHGPSLHERPCCHPALTLLARRERTGGDRRRSVVALLRSGGEEPALDFRILGPFEVLRSGEPVHVPRGKQQAVLALLTAHVGRVVPAERLVDELWGGEPPPAATAVLHRYISKLRRALGGTDGPLVARAPGFCAPPPGPGVHRPPVRGAGGGGRAHPRRPAQLGLGPAGRGAGAVAGT